MKKSLKRAAGILGICMLLSGCSQKSWYKQLSQQTVRSKLNTASVLSNEELYQRAKKEIASGSVLDFYSVTSTAELAVKNFEKAYPKLKGKLIFHKIDDVETYDVLTTEIQNDGKSVDMMLTQNGADLNTKLLKTGLAYQYFPQMDLEQIEENYRLPAVICMINTLFICNNSEDNAEVTNIWQLTEKEWKGKIYFKHPLNETENMNFFVMLTSPKWSKKISEAYQSYCGKTWNHAGTYQSAAYEWIDLFLKNCDFNHGANSQICADVADADEKVMGFFVYNKIRKLDEEEKKKLDVLAYESDMDCFSGYLYAIYATVANTTDCPYTCALFINYLLSNEGFSGENSWNQHAGYYSANSDVHKPDELNDRDFSFWEQNLVIEDSDFIEDNIENVRQFVEECLK